jgi:predicted alpha/beta-hydrolase family hydrolase
LCRPRAIVGLMEIEVDESSRVSALWQAPAQALACYVFAHGAGAGMAHPFMQSMADELGARGIATLRYQFPYVERGSRRPDPPELCHATVRAAVLKAAELAPTLPRFAGGKSFGGRMTSQAQATSPPPGVRGLIFLGFPLHPAGRPSDARGQHLSEIRIPMLFLQGTRDDLADLTLLEPLIDRLGSRATLRLFQDANHSYHARASAGVTDAEIRAQLAQQLADWVRSVLGATR